MPLNTTDTQGTLTLIVSDIFGRTPALETLAEQLPGSTSILDPYRAEHMRFNHEQDAYRYFVDHVGLAGYTETLVTELTTHASAVQLVGFSVGASACWQLVGQHPRLACPKIRQAICFYGSQIRHHRELKPAVNTTLVMPRSENGFDIAELSYALAHKINLTVQHTAYLHGYMNRLSDNFDNEGYAKTMDWLSRQLSDES